MNLFFKISKENDKDSRNRKRMEYLEVLHMDLSTVFGLVLDLLLFLLEWL